MGFEGTLSNELGTYIWEQDRMPCKNDHHSIIAILANFSINYHHAFLGHFTEDFSMDYYKALIYIQIASWNRDVIYTGSSPNGIRMEFGHQDGIFGHSSQNTLTSLIGVLSWIMWLQANRGCRAQLPQPHQNRRYLSFKAWNESWKLVYTGSCHTMYYSNSLTKLYFRQFSASWICTDSEWF